MREGLIVNASPELKQLVEQAFEQHNTSARQLSRRAQDHGFRIADTTINHIRRGTYKSKPSEDTLRAIAWLAGVSDEVAFTAAGQQTPGPPFAEELPPGVDNLSPRSRRAALDVLRALVHAESGDHHEQHDHVPSPPRAQGETHQDEKTGPSDDVNPPSILAAKLARIDELQARGEAATDDEIDAHAAYDPEDGRGTRA